MSAMEAFTYNNETMMTDCRKARLTISEENGCDEDTFITWDAVPKDRSMPPCGGNLSFSTTCAEMCVHANTISTSQSSKSYVERKLMAHVRMNDFMGSEIQAHAHTDNDNYSEMHA